MTEIEYVPWFDESGRQGKSIRTDIALAKRFVRAMRRRRIATLISIVNWNGEAQRRQDDSWYLERVREIRGEIGTDRVIVLGVSEPDGQESGKAYQIGRAHV